MKYPLLLFALPFCFLVNAVAQPPAQTIPAFDFYKADKSVFTNKNLAINKMVFFFFFDPTCEHCQQAMSSLDKNFQNYKKAAVYLISVNDHQTMQNFIDKYAPGLKDQKNITCLQDSKNEFIDRFKPMRYPSMFLYSPTKQLLDYEDNENSMFRFIKYLKQS
jgi:peroxiredoxin